jgi:hypothetical protein
MKPMPTPTDLQRRRLMQLAASGTLGLWAARSLAAGRFPLARGVVKVTGEAFVNDRPAEVGKLVLPDDVIRTGPRSELIYVIDKDAYLVRERSEVRHSAPSPTAVAALRVVTGAVLAVLGSGRKDVILPTATAGIRGTGFYTSISDERMYFCLCYGTVDLASRTQPAAAMTITTRYHDRPVYIGDGSAGAVFTEAPVIDHTDAELIMMESLVGRTPPFVQPGYTSRY